jgi:hypothetical protein
MNWGALDKALKDEANQARYHHRRQRRKSAYREIVWLTVAAIAVIWFVAATIAGNLP